MESFSVDPKKRGSRSAEMFNPCKGLPDGIGDHP